MTVVFNPPPTYAEPTIEDSTGNVRFNPIWLKWFLDLTKFLTAAGDANGVVHNQTVGKEGGDGTDYYHLGATLYAAVQRIAATSIPYVAASGTGDALVANYTPAIGALVDGLILEVGPFAINTLTNPTINVNGLGAKTIVKQNGAALIAGDIAGSLCRMLLVYNASTNSFNLNNPASAYSISGHTFDVPGPIGGTVASTINGTTITASVWLASSISWTVATLPTGVLGARTFVTNALAPTFGAAVVGGGAVIIPVFYNGTTWIVG